MDNLEKLAKVMSRLPGIGSRTAERMALRLIRDDKNLIGDMIAALQEAKKSICCCSQCGNVTAVDADPCRLCSDPGREDGILCVVEEPGDILLMERSGGYHGRYHALMGKISPMKGDAPSDLRIKALVNRVKGSAFKEIIIAVGTDVEGDATARYLEEALSGKDIKISRLAFGLPAGSGVAYSDPITLARAISGRTPAS